jgi:hypothetical protein
MGMRDDIFRIGHHDGRFVRTPGVFVFMASAGEGRKQALYVGEGDPVSSWASPGAPQWRRALGLGFDEILVVVERDREQRKRLCAELVEVLRPELNRPVAPAIIAA